MSTDNQEQEVTVESELADIFANIDSAVDEANLESSSNDFDAFDNKKSEEEATDKVEEEESDGDSGEDIQDSVDDETEEDSDSTDSELSDDEQKAREKGWRPKTEWEGDEKDWVDFGEFNRRTELFDKISSQNKAIKSMQKKMDALINHNKGLVERTREKTIAELEAKRREAIQYGDTEAFDEAEKGLEKAKKEKSVFDEDETETTGEDEVTDEDTSKDPEIPKELNKFFDDFRSKNPWFEKDKEMTDFLVFKTQQIVNGEGIPLMEAMPKAEAEVKKTFAHKFKNPNKSKPTRSMAGSKENRSSGKKSMSSLTPEQKQVWHTLKGVMSEKEFLDQLED